MMATPYRKNVIPNWFVGICCFIAAMLAACSPSSEQTQQTAASSSMSFISLSSASSSKSALSSLSAVAASSSSASSPFPISPNGHSKNISDQSGGSVSSKSQGGEVLNRSSAGKAGAAVEHAETQSTSRSSVTSSSASSLPFSVSSSASSVLAEKPAPAPSLNLDSLEQRLRETKAIGVFTKLSLKNQVDDLLSDFRAYYGGKSKIVLADLRQRYDLLLMKILTLLQDTDAALAADIRSSREAIWDILRDPDKFAEIS